MQTKTQLDPALLQELVNVLTPYMATEAERRAILRLALPNAAYQRIDFHGPAKVFTTNMVNILVQYGEIAPDQQAIMAVLDVLHAQVGGNKQRDIDQLRLRLLAHFQPAGWVACSRCGVSNRTGAKFCRGCGKTLSIINQSGTNALPKLAAPRGPAKSWVLISGGIIVLIALIWVGWPLIGRNNDQTPSNQPFTYGVTVKDDASGQPIPSAEVRIEVMGQAPQAEYTDNNGYARIFISAAMAEQPARLTVSADNYTTATYNIDLWPDRLPDEVRLTLAGRPLPTATLASAAATSVSLASPSATATMASVAGVYHAQINARETYLNAADICVQTGDVVAIKAEGLIKVGSFAGDGGFVGPEGTERGALGLPIGNSYDLVVAFPHSVLMFRLVGETAWRSYAAVPARTFTAPSAGCLEFQINDNDPGNNGDEFLDITVNVTAA